MGTRLEMCDSRWCPLPAPLPHSKIDENTSAYLRQGMVVPVSSSSSSPSPAVAEVPSRGGGSAKAVSKSCSSSGPGESKIEPLIVFDWDDTMLTSSWIQVNELLQAGSYDDLPVEAKRDLAHLERSVIECLKNAHQLGTVIIITNAESGWVELSAARFFKGVLPLLEDVAVVSARSLFEAQFPGSPLCWKSAAFAYMMHDHFLDRPRWIQKKVVSIGDSNEEKVAMRIAAGQHSTMAAKAIKFIAGPDPEALACQLDFVTQHLASVVLSDTDVDIVLDASIVNGTYALPMHSRGVYGDPSPSAAVADRPFDRSAASPDVIVDADVIDITAAASANANSTIVAAASTAAAPRSTTARAPTAVVATTAPATVTAAAHDAAAASPSPRGSSTTMIATVATTSRGGEEDARAASSSPIPIPTPILIPVRIPGGQRARGVGAGGGGGEGGGDCVQPLLPCQIDVGGSSSSSSLCSAVGLKTEPATVVSDDAPHGGWGGVEGGCGGGGAPSEGGSACGGFACGADGVCAGGGGGGGGILVEIKLEGGGGVARVEDGEEAVAAKVLDEAGAVEEGVKGVPFTAAEEATMVVAPAAGERGATAGREGSRGAADAGVVAVGAVEGAQRVVKPAPMA